MKTTLLPQLQTFLVAARQKSFSAAARDLGVSPAAVSQSVRQLEEQLRVVLFTRTTRTVSLTGRGSAAARGRRAGHRPGARFPARGVGAAGGGGGSAGALTVPEIAVPTWSRPVLREFRARHPRVEVEVVVENRLVDIVAEGYDAGVRLHEAIERDMVEVRLTEAFRFVVVGAPSYLERNRTPRRPEDLLRHECFTTRSPSSGALYAWGSWSVGEGTGAFRCEAASSRTTAG